MPYSPRDPCAALAAYFLYTGLCNRVEKVYLALLAARPVCCLSSLFPLHGSVHKNSIEDCLTIFNAIFECRWPDLNRHEVAPGRF